MDLFKSSNPVLSEKKLTGSGLDAALLFENSMTLKGTLQKFGFLFLMVLGSSYFSWKEYTDHGNVQPLILIGAFGGLVVAFIIIFKREWAGYLAPLYALLQGLFIGAISANYNAAFAEVAPNIVVTAVGLTFAVVIAMYLLYSFRIIQVTQKLRSVIMIATGGIFVFYLMSWVMQLFGMPVFPFLHEGGTVGIIFSLVVVGVASLNLLLDFDMIEKGVASGQPKYMEWYGAFGLLVTIVWLYLEILRLLSKLYKR